MEVINTLKEAVVNGAHEFTIGNAAFLTRKVPSGTIVYGCDTYGKEERVVELSTKFSPAALYVSVPWEDNKQELIIIDRFLLGIWRGDIADYGDAKDMEQTRKEFKDYLYKTYAIPMWDQAEPDLSYMDDPKARKQFVQKARSYMSLQNLPSEESTKKDLLAGGVCFYGRYDDDNMPDDLTQILAGYVSMDTVVQTDVQSKEGSIAQMRQVYESIKCMLEKYPDEVCEEWETRLYAASRNALGAKFVTVDFSLDGKTAQGKLKPEDICGRLVTRNDFSAYDFQTQAEGKKVLESLGLKNWHDRLYCSAISAVTYKGKVLYQK